MGVILSKSQDFKELMKDVPMCVSIVLTESSLGVHGCTISSLISIGVSENEQLLLFVLRNGSTTERALQEKELFSICVLSEMQKNLAISFSSKRSPIDNVQNYSDIIYFCEQPIIKGANSVFICELIEIKKKTESSIYICKVLNFTKNNLIAPLVYFDRKYFGIGNEI